MGVAVFILCHHKRDHKVLLSIFVSSSKTNRQGKIVFNNTNGSLNLIHIVAGLGKIKFYFIVENQDYCKANRALQANPERAFPRSYQGKPRTSVPTLLSIRHLTSR